MYYKIPPHNQSTMKGKIMWKYMWTKHYKFDGNPTLTMSMCHILYKGKQSTSYMELKLDLLLWGGIFWCLQARPVIQYDGIKN